MKVKSKTGHLYDMPKSKVCKKCNGERVIFVSQMREYTYNKKITKRDIGYWQPCTCNSKQGKV